MPVGFRIASAWVDIRAEDKGLRQQIKDAVEKATKGQEAKIELKIDSKGLRREVNNAVKEATEKQKPKIALAIKSTGLRKEVTDALKRATEKQKPTVRLGISTVGLRAEVQRALKAATKDQKPTVRLGISTAGLRAEVQRALRIATSGEDGEVTVHIRVDDNRLKRALADSNPTITPNIDVRGLRQRMLAAIRQINVNDDIHINPNIDGDLMARQIQSEVARLRDRYRVRIGTDLDTDTFAARVQAAARSVRGDINIDLNPRVDALKARAEMGAALHSIAGTVPIHLDIDKIRFAAQVREAVMAMNAMPHNLNFRAKIDVDTAMAKAKMAAMAMEMSLINEFLGHGVAGFHSWAGAAIAAMSVVAPLLGTLGPALKTAGTSLAAVVPLTTMAATVLTSLFMGLSNVGKTIGGIFQASVSDVKQLNANMDMLSPNARAFAMEMLRVQEVWTRTKKTVQDSLFQNADAALRDFTSNVLPTLTVGLAGTSMQLNRMGISMLTVFKSAARSGELARAFGAIQTSMEPLVPIPGQFLNMLIKMTMAAGPLLTRMTTSFEGWASRMTEKMNAAFTAGTLQAAISKAGDKIVNFFKRIANNPEWKTFIARMGEAGPRMSEVLGHLTEALLKLINAAAPFGTIIMGIVDAFAQFIKWIPTDFLTMFLTKLMLINIAFKAAAWIMGLTRALAGLRLVLVALNSQEAMMAILNTSKALRTLGATSGVISKLATTIRFLGRSAIVLAALWAGKELIDHFAEANVSAAPDVDKLQQSIMNLVKSGRQVGEFKKAFGDINGLANGFKILDAGIKKNIGAWEHLMGGTAVSTWTRKVIDNFKNGKDSIESWNKKIGSLDKALAELVSGGHGDIAAAFIAKTGISAKDSSKHLKEYNKAVVAAKLAQQLSAVTMGLYGQKALQVQAALDAQKNAAEGLRQSLEALNDEHRKAMGGQIAMEQAIDDATAAVKNNGRTLDINTQKGRDNKKALLDLASATSDAGSAKLEETGSWTQANAIYERGRTQLIKVAEQMGLSETAAKKLAAQILQIPDKTVSITADYENLSQKVTDAQTKLDGLKQRAKVAVGADKTRLDAQVAAAQRELNGLKQQRKVMLDAAINDLSSQVTAAQSKIDALKQKRKTAVGADKTKLDTAIAKAQKDLDNLKQKKKTLIEVRDLVSAGVMTAQQAIDALHGRKVDVVVMTSYQQVRNKGYNGNSATGGHATGGFIRGAGSATSDSILARLSNGEFVLKAAAVKKYGLNFLNGLNQGKMPKFAGGGSVAGYASGGGVFNAGSAIETLTVKANTTDVLSKLAKVSSALNTMNKMAPKAVSIRATDNTKKATDQAKANFKAIPVVSQTAYTKIKGQTAAFGNSLASQMNGVKGKNASVWKSIGSSLQTSITGAYSKVKSATNAFGNNTVSAITGIKTRSNAQWNQFQSQMISSTNKTFSGIKNATASFGTQNVSKFKSIVGSTGSAWGGLSSKFKPPISYLIHTVINKGVVGGMNAIIGKLGGGNKVGGVSVSGFASGGAISGPGSKKSDSILARVSHGEYVMQASAVDKYGSGFMHAVNHGQLPGFAGGGMIGVHVNLPGFASGGSVPSADALNKMIGTGDSGGYKKVADWVLTNIVEPLVGQGPGGSAMKDTMKAGAQFLDKNMATFLEKHVLPSFMGGKIPTGSRLAIINAALKAAGVPPPGSQAQWQAGLNTLITRESGWNASAINRTDSNAKAGHPSQGLAQTIPSTFNAYVPASLRSRGILDPVANVAAAIRYIVSRYGNITNVQQANASKPPQGYRVGGHIQGPGTGMSDSIMARLSNGEYVMTADAVKRYGVGFMNSINAGQLPGFSTGGYTKTKGTGKNKRYYYHGKWYTLAGYRKAKSDYDKQQAAAKAQASSEKEGRGSLTGDLTFSHFGQMAVAQGSWKDNEFENNLGQPGSIGDLVNSLNGYRADIMKSFHGAQETKLLKKLDSSGKALLANEKKLEGVNAALDTAKTTLADLKDKFDSLRDSVAENIKSYGSITKIGKYGTNPTTLLDQLKTDAGKATTFSGQLDQLKAMGIDPDLIQQIASAGITEGGATAQTILGMTPDQVAQLNAYQKQLSDAATKAGNTTADAMYGAGIQAAQGLVDGLTKQQKAIEDAMMAIAKSMEAAIKQALGIKSPSRVMMAVADFTADGLENQLLARTAGIHRVMQNLVVPTTGVSATPIVGKVPGTISTGGPAGHVTNIGVINVNVTGTFNLNTPAERRALAKLLAKDIKEEIRKDDKAHR
jgi:hypothetical protein